MIIQMISNVFVYELDFGTIFKNTLTIFNTVYVDRFIFVRGRDDWIENGR